MSRSSQRWASVSGLTFVGLFVAATIVFGEQVGSAGDPDRQFVSYFSDTTNRVRDITGAYVLVGAGLAFVVFLAYVCAALLGHSGERALPLMALGTGLIFVALLLAAAAALSSVSTSLAFAAIFDEERHEFGPDASRLATQFGFMLLVFAMWAAAACIATISMAGRSTGVLPGWLSGVGFAAAVALLFSFFFVPVAALPVWTAVFSFWLLRREPLTRSPDAT